jgi:hypothetical protein
MSMPNRKISNRRKKIHPIEHTAISKTKNPTDKKSAKRPRGRPRLDAEYVNTRIPKDMLTAIDAWRAKQPGRPKPVRPEAVRHFVALGLNPPKPSRRRRPDVDLPSNLLARVDEWRREGPATRSQAIVHLVETALRLYTAPTPSNLPAPERIHAEGELGKWAEAANMPADTTGRPVHAPEASGATKVTPKTESEPSEPPTATPTPWRSADR